MAEYNFEKLKKEYENFREPVTIVTVDGKDFSENGEQLVVTDIKVELTCGFEASAAEFSIYNSFDKIAGEFRYDKLKKYVQIGSAVSISAGYGKTAKSIFRGFISKAGFWYGKGDMPHMEVSCMDIKGVMMAGTHEAQLKALTYGEAVNEIFSKTVYGKMKSKGIYTELKADRTPDQKGANNEKETDRSIELVNESDYEFIVRCARRFNYEFFVDNGVVQFRKSKSQENVLMELGPMDGLDQFSIEYDVSGLAETVQVRGTDSGNGKLLTAKKKLSNKISMGNKAKQLIQGSERIYIDGAVKSQEEAEYKLEAFVSGLEESFGTLRGKMTGLPELKPGRYVDVKGVGTPPSNRFYVTEVKHSISGEGGFETDITGRVEKIE